MRNVIGRQVSKLRYQRGWTQDGFADRLQLAGWHEATRSAVSKIESRSMRVDDCQMCMLARVLGVSREALYPETNLNELIDKVISQSNGERHLVADSFHRSQFP